VNRTVTLILLTRGVNSTGIYDLLGGACSAYGGGERGVQGVGKETRGKEAVGEIQT
jgi:hypothetical protein